jgi:hypothetical protein
MLLNTSAHWLSDEWVSDLAIDDSRIGTLRLEGGGDVRGPPDEVYNHPQCPPITHNLSDHL